jgi:hypothetical protein
MTSVGEDDLVAVDEPFVIIEGAGGAIWTGVEAPLPSWPDSPCLVLGDTFVFNGLLLSMAPFLGKRAESRRGSGL